MKDGVKILVAFDGSEDSLNALKEAIEIAKKFNGSVTALNVYWDPLEAKHGKTISKVEGIDVVDEGGMRALEKIDATLKKSGARYELRTEKEKNVPETILKIAKKEKFDCIAMGSRGRGGAKAWLLGSVSQRVLTDATVPVLIV